MSGVAASIKLNDQMTSTLKRIDKHLDKLISALTKFESVATKAMTKTSQAVDKTVLEQEKLKQAVEKTNLAVAKTALAQEKVNRAVVDTQIKQESLAKSKINTQIQAQKLTQQEMRTKQMIDKANNSQDKFNRTMTKGVGVASRLGNAIRVGLGAYLGVQGISKTIGLADNLQMTTNRLDLLGNGKLPTDELKQKIYESAMRSRADYLGVADSVAKMGLRTGDTFKSMDELIAFNETLNKMYAIAGTQAHEQFGATLQLIQALGSGVLRGQEFNAVFEAAPNVLQAVAKHMNVPVEKLREMAEDGAITADIIKNAMFEAAEETNEKFKKLKYTFGHVFTGLKNSAIRSFEPVLQQISNITSSERWINFIDGIGITIDKLAKFSSKAFDVLSSVVATCYDLAVVIKNNWSLIEPIIWGIIGALVVYNATLAIGLVKSAIHWMIATYNAIAYQWALFKMAVAQYGFNTALAMCPLTWFLYTLIAIVVVFYLIIAVVNKFTGASISATGLIAGAFSWLGAVIGNFFKFLANMTSASVQFLVNSFNWCRDNVGIAWDNMCLNMKSAFKDVMAWCLNKLASFLDALTGIPKIGDEIAEAVAKIKANADQLSFESDAHQAAKKSYTKFQEIDLETFKYTSLDKAWEKGYNWGANLSGSVTLDKLGKTNSISDLINAESDVGKYLKGGFADNPALDDILKNTKDIANNTAVDTDKEDLSYMRDMAARDAINRHTTRNVKIEMVNNNNVSGDMDLNTILQQIAKTVNDAVNVNASGIHY